MNTEEVETGGIRQEIGVVVPPEGAVAERAWIVVDMSLKGAETKRLGG